MKKYESIIGLGVAGNFAGHLEQANEAGDFKNIEVKEENQPKAIFPFYVPNSKTKEFLSQYPLSHDQIKMPEGDFNVQIEPEIALHCEIEYSDNKVSKIIPKSFAAYNDCSIRRPNAKKISEKKNWGESSKGISQTLIPIDSFSSGGIIENYSITSFHLSDGELHQYGENSSAKSYSYFNEKLLDWVVDRMNNQEDIGPAENISAFIQEASMPNECLLSIGATRYTDYGEANFLKSGDSSIVVVYDHTKYSNNEIIEFIRKSELDKEGISSLVQRVV